MKTTDFVAILFDGKPNPNKVTVGSMTALKALQKGHSSSLVLMAEAVTLSVPKATEGMDIGAPFKPVYGMWESFLEAGGQILVCKSCLIHNGLKEEDMDPRYKLITGDDVVDLLMDAKGSMPVT